MARQLMPLVSVIIPHFNRPRELGKVLQCVAMQNFSEWEVIVADDASREDPTSVVERALPSGRFRVVRHRTNLGPAAARNSGLAEARGKYVAFLDSDDAWHPRKLEAQVAAIESAPLPSNVFCVTRTDVQMGSGRGRFLPEKPVGTDEDFSEFLYVSHGFAQTSSFLLGREAALAIGFHEELRQYEDHLFFIQAGARGMSYLLVDAPLVTWRNDNRPDRLGRHDNLQRAAKYLRAAGPLLTPKARLAFQTRYLGRLLFLEDPRAAIRLFRRAHAAGAVGLRDLATLAARCAMPPSAYAFLRRSLTARRQSVFNEDRCGEYERKLYNGAPETAAGQGLQQVPAGRR